MQLSVMHLQLYIQFIHPQMIFLKPPLFKRRDQLGFYPSCDLSPCPPLNLLTSIKLYIYFHISKSIIFTCCSVTMTDYAILHLQFDFKHRKSIISIYIFINLLALFTISRTLNLSIIFCVVILHYFLAYLLTLFSFCVVS